MKDKAVRIGVIGCGKIARVRHIPEYAAHPGAELLGYYDPNFDRAAEMAERYGGKAFPSVEELLSCREIDAVSVCTPNAFHASNALAALSAGKHVLCEKPMATDLADCEKMVSAAAASGKILMIGFNQRFQKAHVLAKELIDGGAVGKVIGFRTGFGHSGPDNWSVDKGTNNWFFDREKSAFGALFDLGIHKIDLIQFLLSSPVSSVKATLATLDKHSGSGELVSVDDNAVCLLCMESGAVGTLTASWTCYGKGEGDTTLFGTEGVLVIESDKSRVTVYGKDGTKTARRPRKAASSGVIGAFVKAIENGAPSPVPPAEALRDMRVAFAAVRASDTGREIKIGG